jgi:uncharacterized membrane protein YphA (DoxX/SURF4 family)
MTKPTVNTQGTEAVWSTLRIVFGVIPIVAGLDKFTNLLVDWSKYLAPFIAHMVPARGFMMAVGVIEIVAGLFVLFSPWTKIFATIVGLWLLGIALDLVIAGFYDIAVRDVAMAVSAFCLARLTAPVTVHAREREMRPAEA